MPTLSPGSSLAMSSAGLIGFINLWAPFTWSAARVATGSATPTASANARLELRRNVPVIVVVFINDLSFRGVLHPFVLQVIQLLAQVNGSTLIGNGKPPLAALAQGLLKKQPALANCGAAWRQPGRQV